MRHFEDYLNLANQYYDKDIYEVIHKYVSLENEYITTPDHFFRFHSGIPSESLG